jgi:predicted DNA-binding protein
MAVYTKRVQTVLTEVQYEALTQLADETGKPVSVLIREAVEDTYLAEVERRRRRVALEKLLALDAPVADWDQMEDEILEGAVE